MEASAKKQVYNPYLPSYEYIPDGEPHIWNDRVYIYGSHDCYGSDNYCANDYVCWSAPVDDPSDWRYEGIIYKKSQHPYPVSRELMFAPDVAKGKDGRFYLYYSMAHSSVTSVAVCDEPAGKYEYLGDIKNSSGETIGNRAGDLYQFDPAVLVDDDGKIYLYSGFCPARDVDEGGMLYKGAHVCELEEDMVTIKSMPHVIIPKEDRREIHEGYFEAPSIRKIDGLYYLVYSARCTGLYYYYSQYPDKEFKFGGRIHSTSDVGINGHTEDAPAYPVGNTHGGIVKLRGQYYIFNHRLTNNSSYARQGVAEPITIDNGIIRQAEATSCGLNGEPLRGEGEYPAYIACNLFKMHSAENALSHDEAGKAPVPRITQAEPDWEPSVEDYDSGPRQYIAAIQDRCVVGYKYFLIEKDIDCVDLRVRGKAQGTIELAVEEKEGCIGRQDVDINSDEWTNTSIRVNCPKGKQALYVRYEGSGYWDMDSFVLNVRLKE